MALHRGDDRLRQLLDGLEGLGLKMRRWRPFTGLNRFQVVAGRERSPGAAKNDASDTVGVGRDVVEVLAQLHSDENLAGFAAYNLGIALLQDGRTEEAVEQLDRAGRMAAADRASQAIRDKANLVLGSLLFESADFERAVAAVGGSKGGAPLMYMHLGRMMGLLNAGLDVAAQFAGEGEEAEGIAMMKAALEASGQKATATATNLPRGILCMFVGCLMVYTALFATGYWLYGQVILALTLSIIALASAWALNTISKA